MFFLTFIYLFICFLQFFHDNFTFLILSCYFFFYYYYFWHFSLALFLISISVCSSSVIELSAGGQKFLFFFSFTNNSLFPSFFFFFEFLAFCSVYLFSRFFSSWNRNKNAENTVVLLKFNCRKINDFCTTFPLHTFC